MLRLLLITALIEIATGLVLIAIPADFARLLFEGELTGVGVPVGRMAGLGLLSLGIACWPGRDPAQGTGPALRAMLVYNPLATLFIASLAIRGDGNRLALSAVAALHGVLSLLLVRAGAARRAAR
jgi:hypothetical protein